MRSDGYATDYGEQEEGVSCIAAPVRDNAGRVVAAISISGPWIRITSERVPALVPLVLRACADLSAALGYGSRGSGARDWGNGTRGQGAETRT